ncbi:WhiB family transcriptional regulator [Nocardia sp. NPDC051321]|uniref:WhiB family transcriptional regulator n=1 Tax=Nocardia sp. NPDC051321 TaxID=3364323 RepID=UPI003789054A
MINGAGRAALDEVWEWRLRGSCRGMDASVFFHPDRERGRARALREMRAKEICRACPVLLECRTYALAAEEPHGVWGGLSADERKKERTRKSKLYAAGPRGHGLA